MEKKVPFYYRIEEFIIVLLLSIIVVILSTSVVTRYCFRFTFSWAEELSRFLLVWAICAGIGWAGKTSEHLTVTALANAFHKKNPKVEEAIFWIGDILTVLFCAYMCYKLWGVTMTVMKSHQVYTSMQWLPKWPMYFAGVLAMADVCIRIIQRRVGEQMGKGKEEA